MSGSCPAHAVESADWGRASDELDRHGWSVLPGLVDDIGCGAIAALYDDSPGLFRSHVVMERHGFGRGEYRYFAYPLPDLVASMRERLYPHLAPIANRWHERMGLAARFRPNMPTFSEAAT